MATATEAKKRKPPKLFSVTGDSSGIKSELSNLARGKLDEASKTLALLSAAGETFPKAKALSVALSEFIERPTAKD